MGEEGRAIRGRKRRKGLDAAVVFRSGRIERAAAAVRCELCVEIGRAAAGSPQLPPGGGLLLMVASSSAWLRACPDKFNCVVIGRQIYSVCHIGNRCTVRRTGPLGPSGPQPPAAEARCSFSSQACAPQAVARVSLLILHFYLRPHWYSSSQPLFVSSSVAKRPAARSPPGWRVVSSRPAGPLEQARPPGCGLVSNEINRAAIGGPQPPGGGGPQFVAERAPSAGCAPSSQIT